MNSKVNSSENLEDNNQVVGNKTVDTIKMKDSNNLITANQLNYQKTQ